MPRNAIACLAATLAIVGLPAGAAAGGPGTSAWLQPGHDGGQTSFNPDETVITPETMDRLAVAWHGRDRAYLSASAPVVADGIVVRGSWDVSGNDPDEITAWSVTCLTRGQQCRPRWRTKATVLGSQSVVLIAGDVVVATGREAVVGLDLHTGAERWRHSWDGQEVYPETNAVVEDGGTVFLVVESVLPQPDGRARPDMHMKAIDAATGEVRWDRTSVEPWLGENMAAAGGRLFIESQSTLERPSTLFALSQADGHVLWQVPGEGGSLAHSTPIATADTVFLGGQSAAVAYDAATGAQRWENRIWATPAALAGDRVWVEIGEGSSELRALDTTTGVTVARLFVGSRVTDVAVAGGVVLVLANGSNSVFAFDAATTCDGCRPPVRVRLPWRPVELSVADGYVFLVEGNDAGASAYTGIAALTVT